MTEQRRIIPRLALALVPVAALLAGCGDEQPTAVIDPGDGGEYRPEVEPAELTGRIDNPYLPLLPGARWVYERDEGGEVERIVVEVLDERHEVFGVEAVVVRDQVFVNDELMEDTLDWYAQDQAGNVWYLGEETAEYEAGEVVSTAGSWEAGVDGALPGIVMRADPQPGDAYRQEFYDGEAEDMAEVVAVDGSAAVPAGSFGDVITIREWTPLDPEVVEEKHYALGIGVVFENKVSGDPERIDLVEFTPGR